MVKTIHLYSVFCVSSVPQLHLLFFWVVGVLTLDMQVWKVRNLTVVGVSYFTGSAWDLKDAIIQLSLCYKAQDFCAYCYC